MKGPASWDWQEPYFSALREKAPDRLAERLVIAEKAILTRLELLRDAPDNLPEVQALREALDSLYSLMPRTYEHPGKVVGDPEDYEGKRLNRTNLAVLICLATVMAFTAGWILARINAKNVQTIEAGSEPAAGIANSDNSTIASVPDVQILDAPPQGYGAKVTPARNASDAPIVVERNTHAQPETNERSANTAIARDRHATSASARTGETIETSPTSTTQNPSSRPSENPPPQALGSSPPQSEESGGTSLVPSDQPNIAPEARDERQANQTPPIEARRNPQIPSGMVSVSFGTYPSIRVPPELKSQASAASLQIGSLISRVDPIYPEDAKRQQIEGTVKVHAVVGKDGAVQGMEGISGPPLLVSATLSAVRQWRYKPTLLGDQPIETGQDVTIVFQLAKEPAIPN